jgi:glutamine---fructose-6-phosphate transaminase (isomerizing)
MEKGEYTRREIFSQPEAWSAALTVLEDQRRNLEEFAPRRGQVIFTGCGSTYYLALAAAAATQELCGLPARAFPASELWLNPGSSYTTRDQTLLVAVSRSGETTETLRACGSFLSDRRGKLITLSCYPEMPLASMGDLNLVLPSGQEQSVAQTRAFSTLFLAATALAALWSGRMRLFDQFKQLPQAGREMLENADPLSDEVGSDASIDRFYWLGSGVRYGLACELSLKMKEMSLSHSEPFHFLEFRHGPKSMVSTSALVTGLQSSRNGVYENAVLEDVKRLNGRVLVIGGKDLGLAMDTDLDEDIRNVLYLPVGQLIAFKRSLFKGLDPDRPNNLDTVVKL